MVGRLRPDVVVVSADASGAGAVEAVRRMRSLQPSVRIVGISLDDDPSVAGKMLEAGAEACLGSFGSPEGLLAALLGLPKGREPWSAGGLSSETSATQRKL
jgi:DNA-binding NarL/FixJ family response regulator